MSVNNTRKLPDVKSKNLKIYLKNTLDKIIFSLGLEMYKYLQIPKNLIKSILKKWSGLQAWPERSVGTGVNIIDRREFHLGVNLNWTYQHTLVFQLSNKSVRHPLSALPIQNQWSWFQGKHVLSLEEYCLADRRKNAEILLSVFVLNLWWVSLMSEHFGAKLSFLGGVLVIDNVKYLWEHSDEVAASSFKMKKTYLKILICKQWALFT